jgi:hypothetical protein
LNKVCFSINGLLYELFNTTFMKIILFAVINLFLAARVYAQPPHDEPCGAIVIPVVQSIDPCTPAITSTAGVTYNNLAFPSAPCSYTFPDVWYKFVATTYSAFMYTEVANGNGGNAYFIYSASACNGTLSYVSCGVTLENSPVNISNLTPGTTYYIRICINAAFAVDFGVCVYTGFASVGINVPNPLQPLDVSGTASFRDKIGIGETNPQFPLTLSTNVGDKISLYGNTAGAPHYGFGVQGALLQIHSDAAAANIAFGYGSSASFTERARIFNQGEMGMSLTGRLQLKTGTQSAGLWLNNTANNATPAFIGLAADNLVGLYGTAGAGWGLTMNTITGNVGIGLNGAAAQVPLQFSNALGLTKISLYKGTYGDVGIGAYGGELRLQNDIPGGKVSLGVIETTGAYTELAKAQRSGAFAFSVLGSLWVNGTTYASDERFKQNISPISSPIQRLLQLKGVEYEMRTKEFPQYHFTAGRQMGLLAQNVETVVPEAVNEKDGYKGVDYARLIPLLIESIKEQQKQIDELKTQVKILSGH